MELGIRVVSGVVSAGALLLVTTWLGIRLSMGLEAQLPLGDQIYRSFAIVLLLLPAIFFCNLALKPQQTRSEHGLAPAGGAILYAPVAVVLSGMLGL